MSRTTPRSLTLPAGAELLPEPEVKPAEIPSGGTRLHPATLFGRQGPVEIEVGFGKGRFLLAQAAARPDVLFLGLESSQPYLRLVRHRALQQGLANVRLMAADARDVFRRLLAPASVAAVHVLFPDPWPKRRHRHRRLVTPDLLADIARALVPGGALNIVTDHLDYAPAIAAATAAVGALSPAAAFALGDDLAGRTHFATKLADRADQFFARTWTRRA